MNKMLDTHTKGEQETQLCGTGNKDVVKRFWSALLMCHITRGKELREVCSKFEVSEGELR